MQSIKKLIFGLSSCICLLVLSAGISFADDTGSVADTGSIDTGSTMNPIVTAPAPMPLAGQPDVYIVKTSSLVSGNNGDAITYTLVYGNKGDATASGVKLLEEFPSSVSGSLVGWTSLGGGVWEMGVGDLAPGATGQVSITGILQNGATFGANVVNSAAITTTSSETDMGNNQSSVEIKIFTGINNCNCIGTNKITGKVYVDAAKNKSLDVNDAKVPSYPVNLYKSGVQVATTMTNTSGDYVFDVLLDGTYDVVIPNAYLAGYTNYRTTPGSLGGARVGTTQVQGITVTGGQTAPDNNFLLLTGLADVYVKKTASIASGNVGDPILYTLSYGNSGNAIATGIVLMEDFPSAAITGNFTGWTYQTGLRYYNLPDLAPDQTGSVSIPGLLLVGATFGSNVVNSAAITTVSSEVTMSNNVSSVEIKIYSGANNCNCIGNNAIRGTVYVDAQKDGSLSVGDPTLAGIVVNLYRNGVLIGTTTTSNSGYYAFNELLDGTYTVSYVPTAGLIYDPFVANVGDKGGQAGSLLQLANIVLSGGVVSLQNNFGLVARPSGSGGGGGGAGGYIPPTDPTPTPTPVPTPNPKPIIPLPPFAELLDTGPDSTPVEGPGKGFPRTGAEVIVQSMISQRALVVLVMILILSGYLVYKRD